MQRSPAAGCVIDGEILDGSLPLVESPGVSFDIGRNPPAAPDASFSFTDGLRPQGETVTSVREVVKWRCGAGPQKTERSRDQQGGATAPSRA